jgi:hypothetical protein
MKAIDRTSSSTPPTFSIKRHSFFPTLNVKKPKHKKKKKTQDININIEKKFENKKNKVIKKLTLL